MTLTDIAIAHLIPGAQPGRHYDLWADGSIAYWRHPSPQPTPAEITAATLPAAKAQRIEADRQECRRRLVEHYGDALEQVSRATGVYGATAQANLAAGVEASIDASNTARETINAAATVAAVEAVTVSWPVLV